MSNEIFRKALHIILALGFAAVGAVFGVVVTVSLAFVLLCVVLGARRYVEHIPPFLVGRFTYGEIFFALGVAVSAVLFLPQGENLFMSSMLVLGVVDAAAALVGKRWGTHVYRVCGETRTYEGSLTALLCAAFIGYSFGLGVLMALLMGWCIAVIEALAPRGSDNVVLPIVTGLLLMLFM
jgi:phytol kinase